MRYGYWMPVFGGWLRNVEDEGMQASWAYMERLAQRSEQIGYDLSLVAELCLNAIEGIEADSLEAWTAAAALAAVTERLELMVAVRPTFQPPAILAKQAATLDQISGGRLSLNVVSSWWKDEARRYGVQFDEHDDRYARTSEWLDVLDGAWRERGFTYAGKYYRADETVLAPRPLALQDYSVSNRGLCAGFVGTAEQVADRVREYQAVGVDLLLLQSSPQLEEMERFAAEVMPLVEGAGARAAA